MTRDVAERRFAVAKLLNLMKRRHATLLYPARNTEHNQAVALRDHLQSR